MIEALVIHKPMDFVFCSEAFNGVDLMLDDAAIEVSSYADIESAGSAGQDVNPESVVGTVAHGRNGNTRGERSQGGILVRTPQIGIVRDTFSGPVRLALGSLRSCALAQGDRGRGSGACVSWQLAIGN